jgi:molecular chaperone Hsp33
MVTGAILVRETMAPQLRVQGFLLGAGQDGSMVADSHPHGSARGLLSPPVHVEEIPLSDGALFQMTRTLPNGDLHKGTVAFPAEGGVSNAIMTYMLESEQVVSMVSIGTFARGGQVQVAGGYLVQLLPELGDEALLVMTERLQEFPSIERILGGEDSSPRALTDRLLQSMPFTLLDESPLRFECPCDQVRVLASMATLSQEELKTIIDEGTTMEIKCAYCQTDYRVEPEHLRTLLTTA